MKHQNKNNKDNKSKKNKDKNYSELFWNFALSTLIPMWIGIAPKWYEWFSDKEHEHGLFFKNLYEILDGRWLVNVPICLFFIIGTISWCLKIWKDTCIRFHRLLLVALSIVILLYPGGDVTYAKVVYALDYRTLLVLLLTAVLIVMVVKSIKIASKFLSKPINKLISKCFKKKNNQLPITKVGFSDDNLNKEPPKTLQNYANEIIERLLATDLTKQAYAVGITGEWGVGKSTFLDTLESTINDSAEVVRFNPWMCRSPEQVINDFFSSLRHQLSPKYSKLSRSIREYAKYVGSLSVKPVSTSSFSLSIPIKQDSLFERKKALSEKFKKLPMPVVVIIDDIDRLASEEVFEVLRLIRNTADLSNIIYLVAYDKDYVTSVLKEKNIKDSTAYLEKIFQVEVHLPKVDDQLIWNTLYEEIEKQNNFSANYYTKGLFNQFDQDNQELILRILDNYRRAKRFARLYTLNISYLWHQIKHEVKALDVFWLELLQVYDKKTYNILADEPLKLLYKKGERYLLRDGIVNSAAENSHNKFEGEKFWKADTPNILKLLFGNNIETKQQSICYEENYSKYFTLSTSPFKLSISELKQLFVEGASPDKTVETWLNEGKYFRSIVFQFKQISVEELNEKQLTVFLHGVLSFMLRIIPYRTSSKWDAKKLLRQERYSDNILQTADNIIKTWFSEKNSKDSKSALYLSKLLHDLYTTETCDMYGNKEEIYPLLISNDEIEELLIVIIKNYLDYHPNITASALLSEQGELPALFKNCCVNVKLDMNAGDEVYKQVAFDTVIEHFSKKENKPVVKEYEDAYGKLFRTEKPQFDNPLDEDAYWDYMSDRYYRNLQEYFGDSYNSKLEEFKTKCFDTID